MANCRGGDGLGSGDLSGDKWLIRALSSDVQSADRRILVLSPDPQEVGTVLVLGARQRDLRT